MNHNVHVFCKTIFSNKFGFILETVFSYISLKVWKQFVEYQPRRAVKNFTKKLCHWQTNWIESIF